MPKLAYPVFEDAIVRAAIAHRGQTDRTGREPYICHPLRVMEAVRRMLPEDPDAWQAAVLHDVLEDTRSHLDDFSSRIQRLVGCLTRGEQETYRAYIARVVADPVASRIKLCDLRDNRQRPALPDPKEQASLLARYDAAEQAILQRWGAL